MGPAHDLSAPGRGDPVLDPRSRCRGDLLGFEPTPYCAGSRPSPETSGQFHHGRTVARRPPRGDRGPDGLGGTIARADRGGREDVQRRGGGESRAQQGHDARPETVAEQRTRERRTGRDCAEADGLLRAQPGLQRPDESVFPAGTPVHPPGPSRTGGRQRHLRFAGDHAGPDQGHDGRARQ